MAKANGRPRGRPPHKNSRAALPEPGDEQPAYTHAQLVRFDNRFRARLLHAFRKGLESRESAAGSCVPPATDNEPLRILTAHRRASQYQDLATVTASSL
jgi:hypothetical protein